MWVEIDRYWRLKYLGMIKVIIRLNIMKAGLIDVTNRINK
jgi:hypothetical protein